MASHSTDTDARLYQYSGDEEGSRRSRARISRACTRCRQRKDRCDGRQPECSNCANASQPCLYVTATKKRGLPEGYVRGLEKLWAVVLHKVDGLDNVVQRVIDEHEEELLRMWNHPRLGNDLHTSWKDSSVLGDLERLLSRLDNAPIDLKRKRDREDSETVPQSNDIPDNTNLLSTEFRITDIAATKSLTGRSQRMLQWLPQVDSNPVNLGSYGPSLSSTSKSSIVGRTPIPLLAPSTADLEKVPLPMLASTLVDQYFTQTHCWFPILDRPHVLRKFYEHTKSRNPTQLDTSDLACLWAICAYSQQQTRHLRSGSIETPEETVFKLRTMARGLIPSDHGPFLLGHVQALLLVVLLDVGLGDWTSAWMLMGYAVRGSLEATATRDMSQSRTADRQRWQAVFQGCFILDTLVSLRLKRPAHLRASHLESNSPQFLDEDGHEEWEPWGASGRDVAPYREPAFVISCFNRLTELCMIANRAAEAYCDKGMGASATLEAMSRLSSLTERCPFPIADVVYRPPHHVFLQACHFSVRASLPHAQSQFQRSAARHWCAILELFEQSFHLASSCDIPSLLVANCLLVDPLIDYVLSCSPGTDRSRETYNRLLLRFGIVWPGFRTSSANNAAPLASAAGPNHPAQTSDVQIVGNFTVAPAGTNFQSVPNGSAPDPFASNSGYPPHFANQASADYTPILEQPRQPAASDYRPMSIDPPGQGTGPVHGWDAAAQQGPGMGLGTSPSFNGDEIDALFHEMAQLDTTQWSMDRTQGLKDFGFADDSTFEAFCNDRDRLMLSDGDLGPAFDNRGIVASGSHIPQLDTGGTQLGRMSFDDIFR